MEYWCFFQVWGRYQDRERLVHFLAHGGIASRRHAEELMAAGRVQAYDQFSID
jgi:16S rRNA U516 pseudouridylate synthase RsuA-like enzyme